MYEKILVVDDDPMSLEVVQAILKHQGFEVIGLQEGSRAWELVDLHQPNLVILDVMMPDMNGYMVAQKLRTESSTKHIPIIMLTAMDSMKHRVVGLKSGADQYLVKPIHPVELITVVKNLLERMRYHKEESSEGLVIGVIGAKGGVGTTTVAINLAATLLRQKQSPLLIDFHALRGAINHYLHLGEAGGISRILDHETDELTSHTIEHEIHTHQSGLRAILSSNDLDERHKILTRDKVGALKAAARQVANPVIIDMSHHHGFDMLNEILDRVIVVLEPYRVALTMAHPLIDQMAIKGRTRISIVIVNRSSGSLQLSRQQISDELDLPVVGVISAAPELAFQAAESGVPMVLMQPVSTVKQQFVELTRQLFQLPSSNGNPIQ